MKALYAHENPPSAQNVIEGRLIEIGLRVLELGNNVVLDFGLWGRDERTALRQAAHWTSARWWSAEAPHTTWPMSPRNSPSGLSTSTSQRRVSSTALNLSVTRRTDSRPGANGAGIAGRRRLEPRLRRGAAHVAPHHFQASRQSGPGLAIARSQAGYFFSRRAVMTENAAPNEPEDRRAEHPRTPGRRRRPRFTGCRSAASADLLEQGHDDAFRPTHVGHPHAVLVLADASDESVPVHGQLIHDRLEVADLE